MKKNKIILFVSFFALLRCSLVNSVGFPIKPDDVQLEVQETHLHQTQSLLVKQAFLSIKPESEGLEDACKARESFINEEGKNKVLIGVRQLFIDRTSYLKALAIQAETEKYPAFAALLYRMPYQEKELEQKISDWKNQFQYKVCAAGVGLFLLGAICRHNMMM